MIFVHIMRFNGRVILYIFTLRRYVMHVRFFLCWAVWLIFSYEPKSTHNFHGFMILHFSFVSFYGEVFSISFWILPATGLWLKIRMTHIELYLLTIIMASDIRCTQQVNPYLLVLLVVKRIQFVNTRMIWRTVIFIYTIRLMVLLYNVYYCVLTEYVYIL